MVTPDFRPEMEICPVRRENMQYNPSVVWRDRLSNFCAYPTLWCYDKVPTYNVIFMVYCRT